MKSIIRKDGYKGLFRGLLPTMLREVPCWGVYFLTYEVLKERAGVK